MNDWTGGERKLLKTHELNSWRWRTEKMEESNNFFTVSSTHQGTVKMESKRPTEPNQATWNEFWDWSPSTSSWSSFAAAARSSWWISDGVAAANVQSSTWSSSRVEWEDSELGWDWNLKAGQFECTWLLGSSLYNFRCPFFGASLNGERIRSVANRSFS